MSKIITLALRMNTVLATFYDTNKKLIWPILRKFKMAATSIVIVNIVVHPCENSVFRFGLS